jgi:hypothetical protein
MTVTTLKQYLTSTLSIPLCREHSSFDFSKLAFSDKYFETFGYFCCAEYSFEVRTLDLSKDDLLYLLRNGVTFAE